MNRFHEAAREGHLDLLRDATRRDANKPDDTGRTPTLWAAYEGNTDALRLLVSRGGDPDHCDIQGHTALHYAALSGHINTVTFLVSFGCNIWAMTNDYRTAKDLAAENNHRECLAFLDDIAAEQSAKNRKQVQKLKEKTLVDADKRVKKLRKMQAEHGKWLEKEEKKRLKDEDKKHHPGGLYTKKPGGRKDGSSPVDSTAHRHSTGALFSEITTSNGTSGSRGRSKSSLMPSTRNADDNRNRSTVDTRSIDRNAEDSDDDKEELRQPDIQEPSFWRPIDGSGIVKSVQSLPPSKPGEGDGALEEDLLNDAVNIEHDYRQTNGEASVPDITVSKPDDYRPSYTNPNSNELNWDPDYLDNDDDDEFQSGTSDLEFFLAVHNLLGYLPVFTREEIDLKALMLLLDEDFVKLGFPLGPRRKLTDAISRRRTAISAPGVMVDTQL